MSSLRTRDAPKKANFPVPQNPEMVALSNDGCVGYARAFLVWAVQLPKVRWATCAAADCRNGGVFVFGIRRPARPLLLSVDY